MYIKQVIIDGFKSYAQRTEVNGFDPQFNAITGLNGSGKSNILDSICFLLGISNLQQVRASNLQELVYKGGQAGVTKATVTISFDNSDKKQSPVGYETFDEITVSRQVVIGGRNKYLINGSNANNTRVQDLFRSVQLNVNNPHFLIMQGRITKVLNMKPPEILSMIEEAAGTRMYESKKLSAQKTIEKKESKLKEIETILNEEITPTLKKLKEERSSYLDYQKTIRELEHLTRLYIAYQFVQAEEIQKKSVNEYDEMANLIKTLKEKSVQIEEQIKVLNGEIGELEKKRNEEAGEVIKNLENKVNELSKVDVKANSDVKHAKDQLAAENKKKKALLKSLTDDQNQLTSKESEMKKMSDNLIELKKKSEEDTKLVTNAQDHFHAVSAGLSSNDDGEDQTLADQLLGCKNDISNAETELKQAQMKAKHAQAELKKKQNELKKTEKDYSKDKMLFDDIQKNVKKLESEMKRQQYEEGQEERLVQRKRELEEEVAELRTKTEMLEARFPNLQFQYKDPEPNFNRKKVKGLVAQLIKVKNVSTATALEVAAGNKLYNVVVDTQDTGKKLLQKGELKRRYTIIPLNKISSRTINPNTIKKAKSLVGDESVNLALSLVGYEKDVEAAMSFVFGGSFVCDTQDNAKTVTFNPDVRSRCVTLDGDVFDPAGTLTGGARSNNTSILAKLQELNTASEAFSKKSGELDKVMKELENCKKVAEKFRQLKQQYDLKIKEAELIESKLKQSTHHHQLEEVNSLQKTVEEQVDIEKKAKKTIETATAKSKSIEEKMKEAKTHRERELKKAEEDLNEIKKKAEESCKDMKNKEQKVEELKLEIEEIRAEVANVEQQIASTDEVITELEKQIEDLLAVAENSKKACREAEENLKEQKKTLRACNEAINTKISARKEMENENNDNMIKVKELDHKMVKFQKDSKDAAHKVERMIAEYQWIDSERQFFGKPNTAYDFSANDMPEVSRRLAKLQETKDKLGKNVNMRAMNMLGKAEEKYNDLMKKKGIVENDKAKIEQVIAELDEKKNEALKKAFEKVNIDFGSIFSTLLPGTSAKLAPPEGQTVLDGLEVKVAFGSVWKESLGELSGGQRSLVALSLILAMLLFKPAPLYILDEVDAALDLSHTQNIGQMLKTHFKHSQFIVVSLKDGMFNNANVLFKTKFVDGVSTVTRYAQNPSHHAQRDTARRIQPSTDRSKKRRVEADSSQPLSVKQ
ncbi:structural maintenance of chromosomes protein 2-like [Dendronephthya gigantea]|uniref:structural maintenance of chromosomes protein 2-like n=1 Tax=Dendronephthya gigantea TaxID=151771 RepID=UPI00106D5040|nr:structural maintenance of chromosomes protein 2-like [Dendronephthya gigantea]